MNDRRKESENEFSQKLTDILNYGALNLAMGVGYRTGLFEVMDNLDTPQSAAVISKKAGLAKRYVLEWLGVMVTGGIVDLHEGQKGKDLFKLPKAHADLITQRAGNNNMGVYTQEIPLLTASVFEAVLDGFKTGKGIPYDRYPGFQTFMTELADAKHRQILISRFLPSVSNGIMVKRLKEGIGVLDVGCGEGLALMLMAEAFPNSRFLGIDIAQNVISKATSAAEAKGLQNISFQKRDAALLKEDGDLKGSFDYVTAFDAVHDQTQPLEALRGIHAALKDGGVFSMVDIAASSDLKNNMDHPMGMFLYTVSLMHCMPVGLHESGMGLGMMWGREKAVKLLQQVGFEDVSVEAIPDDPFNLHFFCRKNPMT